MKNRTLVFCLCAIVFASASAFTSANLAQVDAWVIIGTQAEPDPHCVNTLLKCEVPGADDCVISVFKDTAPSGFIATNGRDHTRGCAPMGNDTDEPQVYNPTTIINYVEPLE